MVFNISASVLNVPHYGLWTLKIILICLEKEMLDYIFKTCEQALNQSLLGIFGKQQVCLANKYFTNIVGDSIQSLVYFNSFRIEEIK